MDGSYYERTLRVKVTADMDELVLKLADIKKQANLVSKLSMEALALLKQETPEAAATAPEDGDDEEGDQK